MEQNLHIDLFNCPNCKQIMMPLEPPVGDAFILSSYDTKTNNCYTGNGIQLRAFFCPACGAVQLSAPSRSD